MKTTIEENKALVQRFFAAIENNRVEEFDAIVAINYDYHLPGQSPGRKVLKKYFSGLHVAFKDLKLPIHKRTGNSQNTGRSQILLHSFRRFRHNLASILGNMYNTHPLLSILPGLTLSHLCNIK